MAKAIQFSHGPEQECVWGLYTSTDDEKQKKSCTLSNPQDHPLKK